MTILQELLQESEGDLASKLQQLAAHLEDVVATQFKQIEQQHKDELDHIENSVGERVTTYQYESAINSALSLVHKLHDQLDESRQVPQQ